MCATEERASRYSRSRSPSGNRLQGVESCVASDGEWDRLTNLALVGLAATDVEHPTTRSRTPEIVDRDRGHFASA